MGDSHDASSSVFMTQGNEVGVDLHAHRGDVGDHATGLVSSSASLVVGDPLSVSESTRLHHKLREMKEMDDALALMKSDYAERIRLVKEGEARFLVKQHNIIKVRRGDPHAAAASWRSAEPMRMRGARPTARADGRRLECAPI